VLKKINIFNILGFFFFYNSGLKGRMWFLIKWLDPTLAQTTNFFVVIEYKIIYILNIIIAYLLQLTPTWFSRDDVIVMRSILVNAILQTLRMLDFGT